ncbi:hypothetical protein OSTOST_12445, partial [Ostertagia ostertagi]
VKDVDAILVPSGGGGLVAGTCVAAKALSPNTKVIALVPENCPSLLKSLEAGKPVFTKSNPTLADGLAVPLVGVNSFHTLKSRYFDFQKRSEIFSGNKPAFSYEVDMVREDL